MEHLTKAMEKLAKYPGLSVPKSVLGAYAYPAYDPSKPEHDPQTNKKKKKSEG